MASSRERIIQACNGLQVPAISLDWADQAWSSDFCEPVELPEILENRIVDCKYFVGLWKVLSDNSLSHKVLISGLYSFIDSGDKWKRREREEMKQQQVVAKQRQDEGRPDAVKLLHSYSLKDSEQVLDHVIQLFVETTRLEVLPLTEMTFDFPGVLNVFVLNFMVFKHLISNFLMISGSSSVTSNGLVMRDVQTMKDQAIQFVNHAHLIHIRTTKTC
ncbi:hypothetical protein P5673_009693 [Acropora cervicornis]|uniref:Uncharacterized protein n=1 Tax=Acropora cervicornis TaxID=6130 RepID=A0AAD9V9I5_ACRCE|nr:hypothetical protein P5673_009693 [Acropora cervicornis]